MNTSWVDQNFKTNKKRAGSCRGLGGRTCALLLATLMMPALADVITWTGAGNGVSLYETNNWAGAEVIGVSNFKGVPVAHDFVVNDGAATVGGGGGVGGTLDLDGSGSLTVSAGSIKLAANAIFKDGTVSITGNAFDSMQGTLDNADLSMSWGLSLLGAMHLKNGSTLVATWFAGGNGVSSLDGGSMLTIREDGAGTFNNNTVNFLDLNSTIVYSNPARTIAEVTSEHLANFTVNGDAPIVGSNIRIFTNGSGFTSVQAIPEPGALSLLLGGTACVLLLRAGRRKLV